MRAFVTGSTGSVGTALTEALGRQGGTVTGYDIVTGRDILDFPRLERSVRLVQPDVIFHLAGAKHAPDGEADPFQTTRINVEGTHNVLTCAPAGCRVILASTCKAANAETAYGASKLIAERMVLNAGHSVARFYNVRKSSGNVFEIWAALKPPLPATSCRRYFITMEQGVGLLLRVATEPPGRYTVNPGENCCMIDEAAALVGRENVEIIKPRRGDRLIEPRTGTAESLVPIDTSSIGALEQIHSRHD